MSDGDAVVEAMVQERWKQDPAEMLDERMRRVLRAALEAAGMHEDYGWDQNEDLLSRLCYAAYGDEA